MTIALVIVRGKKFISPVNVNARLGDSFARLIEQARFIERARPIEQVHTSNDRARGIP